MDYKLMNQRGNTIAYKGFTIRLFKTRTSGYSPARFKAISFMRTGSSQNTIEAEGATAKGAVDAIKTKLSRYLKGDAGTRFMRW